MLDKLKQYLTYILEGLVAILTLVFLFEKSKADSAEAIVDNKEILDKVNKDNQQIAVNNGQLQSEEKNRKEIKKAAEDAKSDDPTSILNKR